MLAWSDLKAVSLRRYSYFELHQALEVTACYPERLSHGLETRYIISFEFISDPLKTTDRLLRVESLSAPKANLSRYFHGRRVHPTSQKLLDFLFHHFAPTNRALLKWHHGFFLSRQLIHWLGLGRYTVTSTAHLFALL